MNGIVHKYEEHHHVKITQEALQAAVDLSSRYINDRNLPDKAIDLIDEASSAVRLKYTGTPAALKELEQQIRDMDSEVEELLAKEDFEGAGAVHREQEALIKKYERKKAQEAKKEKNTDFVVGENDIAEVVSMWTKIPVKKIAEKESDRLLKLEKILHKRVIGQEDAVTAVSKYSNLLSNYLFF